MIGRMLEGYPSKPAVVVAVILIISAMSIYYFDQNRTCTDIASMRSQLYSLAENNVSNEIRLVDTTDIQWDKARIIVDYKTEGKLLDCPFDWGWTQQHRQELMARGLLNMIVFTWKDVVIAYLDFNRDRVDFELVDIIVTPDSAVFSVERNDTNTYLLRQAK